MFEWYLEHLKGIRKAGPHFENENGEALPLYCIQPECWTAHMYTCVSYGSHGDKLATDSGTLSQISVSRWIR